MARQLRQIAEDVSLRFALRRRMLERMGIETAPDLAPGLREEIRKGVIACSGCGNPEMCKGWLDQGGKGAPVFCPARAAFLELAEALDAVEAARIEARDDVAWVAERLRALQTSAARGAV